MGRTRMDTGAIGGREVGALPYVASLVLLGRWHSPQLRVRVAGSSEA